MPTYKSFDEFSQKALAYFEKEETLQTAYDTLTEAAPHFPEQARIIYNWRYCAAALLGKSDLALQLMQEALDAGFWYREDYFRNDEDLKSLQGLPEFNRLVEENERRHQAAQAEAKPLLLTMPAPATTTEPLPLLMTLHGNNSNAENSVEFWESAVEHGWLTALPQSSQVFSSEGYVWDDFEWGARELKAHYQELSTKHPVDSARVIVGGFSKGGEMAIWLALKEVIPLAGFIAVNPGGPLIQEPDDWKPLLEGCNNLADLRGFFLAGENDPNLENIKTTYEMLNSHGLACELVVAPEIAHDFPEDFSQILAQALKYVLGG